MKLKCILISAGHGKSAWGFKDCGAVSPDKTMKERDINVAVARQLITILKDKKELEDCLIQGVGVETEANISAKIKFSNKVVKENKFNSDECLYIDIHCNSSTNTTANGTEIYTPETGKAIGVLAESIINSRLSYFPELRSRGVKDSTGTRAGYIDDFNGYSMLIEMAFISNTIDQIVLKQEYRNAESIAHGLLEYLRKNGR